MPTGDIKITKQKYRITNWVARGASLRQCGDLPIGLENLSQVIRGRVMIDLFCQRRTIDQIGVKKSPQFVDNRDASRTKTLCWRCNLIFSSIEG
jgi:hypothetical protein